MRPDRIFQVTGSDVGRSTLALTHSQGLKCLRHVRDIAIRLSDRPSLSCVRSDAFEVLLGKGRQKVTGHLADLLLVHPPDERIRIKRTGGA